MIVLPGLFKYNCARMCMRVAEIKLIGSN